MARRSQVTCILRRIQEGDLKAVESLLPLVYAELRRLAGASMKAERHSHTLQPTALVHEAYLQLFAESDQSWENRAHFFSTAARAMRRILVDHAREKGALKRGAARTRIELSHEFPMPSAREDSVIAVDAALEKLARVDERKGQVVELLFFGGLTAEEAASVLGISRRTVLRDWQYAKAWLYRSIRSTAPRSSPETD